MTPYTPVSKSGSSGNKTTINNLDYNDLEKWHRLGKESGITELKKFYAKNANHPAYFLEKYSAIEL